MCVGEVGGGEGGAEQKIAAWPQNRKCAPFIRLFNIYAKVGFYFILFFIFVSLFLSCCFFLFSFYYFIFVVFLFLLFILFSFVGVVVFVSNLSSSLCSHAGSLFTNEKRRKVCS